MWLSFLMEIRRWAKKTGVSAIQGHYQGCQVTNKIVEASKEIGVKTLTLYTFSTENWNRPSFEVQALMNLLVSYLSEETPHMVEKGVHFETIGNIKELPSRVQAQIQLTKDETKNNSAIDLILAINYGGRDEIKRSFQAILEDISNHKLKKEEITEELISKYLDTSFKPDPELLIRTSGEMRISNFLLWQLSYAELFMSQVFWPDFTPDLFLEAILTYQKREKRGGV